MAKFFGRTVWQGATSALLLTVGVLVHPSLHAQSDNVLGLPAIPQTPRAQTPAVPTSATAAARPKPTDAEVKSVLSGNISLASFYQEGLITVKANTVKAFVGSALRAQALQAARLVQRDVKLACGKLCKPGPMPAPTFQENNTLQFDLVISGYEGKLTAGDMANLFNAKAIGPGSKAAPSPPPAPQAAPVSVVASTATAAPAATATAAPP